MRQLNKRTRAQVSTRAACLRSLLLTIDALPVPLHSGGEEDNGEAIVEQLGKRRDGQALKVRVAVVVVLSLSSIT